MAADDEDVGTVAELLNISRHCLNVPRYLHNR
jgi:hypothetical protein